MVKTIVEESLAVLDGKNYEVRPQAASEPDSFPEFLDEHWLKNATQKVFANHVIFYYQASPSTTGGEVTGWNFVSNVLVVGNGEIIAGYGVRVDFKGAVEVTRSKTRPFIQSGMFPTLDAVFTGHRWLPPKPKPLPKVKTASPSPIPGTASAPSSNHGSRSIVISIQ